MNTLDLKDSIKQLMDDFRQREHSPQTFHKALEELTQRICIIVDVASHRDTMQYYKLAYLDEAWDMTMQGIPTQFNPNDNGRVQTSS